MAAYAATPCFARLTWRSGVELYQHAVFESQLSAFRGERKRPHQIDHKDATNASPMSMFRGHNLSLLLVSCMAKIVCNAVSMPQSYPQKGCGTCLHTRRLETKKVLSIHLLSSQWHERLAMPNHTPERCVQIVCWRLESSLTCLAKMLTIERRKKSALPILAA